jgi:hypothetical protein
MGRITINDLPEDQTISKEEMRQVLGGTLPTPLPSPSYFSPYSSPQRQFSLGYFTSPIQLRGTLPIPIP